MIQEGCVQTWFEGAWKLTEQGLLSWRLDFEHHRKDGINFGKLEHCRYLSSILFSSCDPLALNLVAVSAAVYTVLRSPLWPAGYYLVAYDCVKVRLERETWVIWLLNIK